MRLSGALPEWGNKGHIPQNINLIGSINPRNNSGDFAWYFTFFPKIVSPFLSSFGFWSTYLEMFLFVYHLSGGFVY